MKRSGSLFFLILAAGLLSLAWTDPLVARPTGGDRPGPLGRFVILEEGKCSPLPDNCNCGNFRRQGSKCLFEVVRDADGTEVPKARLYAATLDCGECQNNDPPAPAEKVGAVTLRGPRNPKAAWLLDKAYDSLLAQVKEYREKTSKPNSGDDMRAVAQIQNAMQRVARILVEYCVGYFYDAVPEDKRIPFLSFTYDLSGHSSDGAPMITSVQVGAPHLSVFSDCFYDSSLQPTPEVFCAALLHEIYHWQQEGYGAGSSDLEHILYELACTEKMRLNSFYIWILEADRANKEFHIPQREYWLPRFEKEWAKLDKAGQKAIAGWAWSRGGIKDATPEDSLMRDMMYFRIGWFSDVWETLFKATGLRIIRLPISPMPVSPLIPLRKKIL